MSIFDNVIDDNGMQILNKAKDIISHLDRNQADFYQIVEETMKGVYHYFSKYPEEVKKKDGFQYQIFLLENLLSKDFIPSLKTEPIFDISDKSVKPSIYYKDNSERIMERIVFATRKWLNKDYSIKTASLKGKCINTCWFIREKFNIAQVFSLCPSLKPSFFHYFGIVSFTLLTKERKSYLIDCTYRQFFTLDDYFIDRIAINRRRDDASSIGAYMTMTPERTKIAEELLTKGYIEATPENFKTYLDAIVFCGQDYEYYISNGLNYLNPNDCIPPYSLEDYLNKLIENRVINASSVKDAARMILSISDEEIERMFSNTPKY